jgi:putative membrane protein
MSRLVIPILALVPLACAWPDRVVAQGTPNIGQPPQSPANTSPTTPDTSVPAKVAPPVPPVAPSAVGPAIKNESTRPGTLTASDADFVRKAILGDMMEVAAGRLAVRSKNGQVRDFGRHMVEDHSKLGQQIAAIARSKGDVVPAKLDSADSEEIGQLSKLTGRDFDHAYAVQEIKAHQDTVAIFEQEAKGGTDPDLKALAQAVLPMLQHHLQSARDVEQKLAAK